MSKYLVGFDLGGTKMMAGLLTRKFEIKERHRKKSRPDKGAEKLFGRVVETVQAVLDKSGVTPADLVAIGVGSPGPLDPATGRIIDTPNLGLKDFPLGERLAETFGCPVFVDNDVNVGTYGEYHFGAGNGSRHLVGVFPGTGIGGGLILDGKIFHGASGAAGEIGHLTLDPNGPRCGCGKPGCTEAHAGRNVIASRLALQAMRGQAPYLLKHYGADIQNIRSNAMRRAIENGDALVEETIRRAAFRIGITCADVVNLLSPDTIVLGGGLVEAMPELFREEVERALDVHCLPFLRQFCTVKIAKLGDDATMLGAAKMAADRAAE